MRNVHIISGYWFPRAGASSNYLQYLACSLADAGYNIKMCVCKNDERYEYLENMEFFKTGKIVVNEFKGFSGKGIFWRILNRFDLNTVHIPEYVFKTDFSCDDVIIFYGRDHVLAKELLKIREKVGSVIIACPVEHFRLKDQTVRFKLGAYCREEWFYNKYLPQMNICFPISSVISKDIKRKGGKTFVLPIMADTGEYDFVEKGFKGKYKIIYPTNKQSKDSLKTMIQALAELDDELIQKVEFHICGLSYNNVKMYMKGKQLDKVRNSIVVHPWMSYDTLVQLYRDMHFLFIARPTNQMTESNFPSKVPEVMCHGIVPIATRVGDYTRFYLKDKQNSVVFEGDSKEACLCALRTAISLPFKDYLSLSINARKCAENYFDYHNWSAQLKEQIESLFC